MTLRSLAPEASASASSATSAVVSRAGRNTLYSRQGSAFLRRGGWTVAKRRLLKVVIIFIALFVTIAALGMTAAWVLVLRGPSVPDHATLVLRIGGTDRKSTR